MNLVGLGFEFQMSLDIVNGVKDYHSWKQQIWN